MLKSQSIDLPDSISYYTVLAICCVLMSRI